MESSRGRRVEKRVYEESLQDQDDRMLHLKKPKLLGLANLTCDYCGKNWENHMIEELQSDGRFLLVKRPDEGLLAGLWEFPSVLLGVETDLATRRNAIDKFLKKSFNLEHKTMAWKSVDSKALSSMGLTSGVRKVYSMIEKFKQNKSKPIPGKARKKKKS